MVVVSKSQNGLCYRVQHDNSPAGPLCIVVACESPRVAWGPKAMLKKDCFERRPCILYMVDSIDEYGVQQLEVLHGT